VYIGTGLSYNSLEMVGTRALISPFSSETLRAVVMDFDFFLSTVWKDITASVVDLFALAWFLFCWFGYSAIVDNFVHSSHGLSARMHLYRIQWMTAALKRENRVVDINIISSLSQSISFFASTSILIIAGFLAILSATETAMDIIRELPFASQPTIMVWYIKISLMVSLFVYAFFKYTWSLRQLNYSAILIGAMPIPQDNMDDFIPAARRAAMVATMSARHMNRGLRTYYFAMAALSWFLNPWLFIIGSGAVVWILYRREFSSDIVSVLNMPSEEKILMRENISKAHVVHDTNGDDNDSG
jgi:uncharacterized membrane protein